MNRKQMLRFVIFGFVFCIVFSYASKVLVNKTDQDAYAPFFTEREDYDVLFFGSSVTVSGISPLDMWKDNGICSWNLANNGQTLALNYYCMKNALKQQDPKLCVVDLTYLGKKDLGEVGRIHALLDNFPVFCPEKFEVMEEFISVEEWGNYLIPLVYYHGRWKELSRRDFREPQSRNRGSSIMKKSIKDGVVFDTSVFDSGPELPERSETASIPEINVNYCKKMIELCEERGIEILFIHFPQFISDEYYDGNARRIWGQYNEFAGVVEEYDNASYVDFNYGVDDIDFDYTKHMRDTTHLNIEGNRKMTSVLGTYIKEKYEIPDRRMDERLEHWNDDWDIWDTYRRKLIEEVDS